MRIRRPAVAGQFYPADADACRAEVQACLAAETLPASLPEKVVAGIVPHAGWTFSGALAALVFAAVRQRTERVATFAVCGAAHGYRDAAPVVDDSDGWETPLGTIEIDAALRDRLVEGGTVTADASAHRHEHSIEVQVPFIQHLFPEARLLPIIVPPVGGAVALGDALAEVVTQAAAPVVCIGSTDLTHYGPRYGFIPKGAGPDGTRWAHAENDRTFLDLALRVEPEALLTQALECGNACGPGAAAAVTAVARRLGVAAGMLLAQTDSNEIMRRKMGTSGRDSVGYAALVF